MAKSLKELDQEFQERRGAWAAEQPEAEAEPVARSGTLPPGRLDELDRAFREEVKKKAEAKKRRAAISPGFRLLWRRKSKRVRDGPLQASADGRAAADPGEKHTSPPLSQTEPVLTELPPQTEAQRRTMYRRHAVSVFANILFYAAMLTLLISAWAFAQNSGTLGNGTRLYNVLTTSMQSVYPKGSLVVVKDTDPGTLVVGNDITFYIDANTTVTHRIVSIIEDYQGTGERAFETKGVENSAADDSLVRESAIVGKVVFFLPVVGSFLATFRERLWVIVLFFVSVVGFSFFINLTFGETWQERKECRARKILEQAAQQRWEEQGLSSGPQAPTSP